MINLDGLTPEELLHYADQFKLLGVYAQWKAKAMALRVQGSVRDATRLEKLCEFAYSKLDNEFKW